MADRAEDRTDAADAYTRRRKRVLPSQPRAGVKPLRTQEDNSHTMNSFKIKTTLMNKKRPGKASKGNSKWKGQEFVGPYKKKQLAPSSSSADSLASEASTSKSSSSFPSHKLKKLRKSSISPTSLNKSSSSHVLEKFQIRCSMMEGDFCDREQKTPTPTELRTADMDTKKSPPLKNPHDKLGVTSFSKLLAGDPDKTSFIDKSLLMEVFFNKGCYNRVIVTAPRRFGKTINLSMIRHFSEFTIQMDINTELSEEEFESKLKETKNYKLFSTYGLEIMKKEDTVKKHFGRYPVISVSFKCEGPIRSYDQAMHCCGVAIQEAFEYHSYLKSSPKLNLREIRTCQEWCNDVKTFDCEFIKDGLRNLAAYLYKHFNREVVLLVDDYDSVITQSLLSESITKVDLKMIVEDTMTIIKNAVKLDEYVTSVEYAFITGISHISGLGLCGSNIESCKFLHGHDFVKFYGLTSKETKDLLIEVYHLTEDEVKVAEARYNGYESLDGTKIYSLWSLLKFARKPSNNQRSWKDTGMIVGLEQAFKIQTVKERIETLLCGEYLDVIPKNQLSVNDIVDLFDLLKDEKIRDPSIFFNFLQEQGYLTFVDKQEDTLKVPNEEIREEYFKKISDHVVKVYGIEIKLLKQLKAFFCQIFTERYDKKDFEVFHFNLQKLIQYDLFTKNEANLKFLLNLLTYDLEFRRVNEIPIKPENNGRYVDYAIIKNNCAFVFELECGHSSKKALEILLEKKFDALVTDDINHYVLMGINMNKHGRISMSYLYNNKDMGNMETIE